MPRPAWEDVESVKQIATDPNVDIVINRSNKNIAHAFSYKVNCDTLAATREQTVLHTIRRLAGSYMSVCNVIVGFNSNDGFLIILLLATNALQMEKYLYTIVLIQWSNQPYCIGGDYLNDVFSLYVISYLKFYEDEELEEKNLVIMKPPYNVNYQSTLFYHAGDGIPDKAISNELDMFCGGSCAAVADIGRIDPRGQQRFSPTVVQNACVDVLSQTLQRDD
ncbi:jg12427 [Pararge aegeria aegeria]|uniref:Jg12427 protein n=1 Tax=Pararge aegeria aegeria TaxID=348720 RepID=A0A8S4RBM3_9NEOP|nr:jg12427 [Pararge aegeria aegeria]